MSASVFLSIADAPPEAHDAVRNVLQFLARSESQLTPELSISCVRAFVYDGTTRTHYEVRLDGSPPPAQITRAHYARLAAALHCPDTDWDEAKRSKYVVQMANRIKELDGKHSEESDESDESGDLIDAIEKAARHVIAEKPDMSGLVRALYADSQEVGSLRDPVLRQLLDALPDNAPGVHLRDPRALALLFGVGASDALVEECECMLPVHLEARLADAERKQLFEELADWKPWVEDGASRVGELSGAAVFRRPIEMVFDAGLLPGTEGLPDGAASLPFLLPIRDHGQQYQGYVVVFARAEPDVAADETKLAAAAERARARLVDLKSGLALGFEGFMRAWQEQALARGDSKKDPRTAIDLALESAPMGGTNVSAIVSWDVLGGDGSPLAESVFARAWGFGRSEDGVMPPRFQSLGEDDLKEALSAPTFDELRRLADRRMGDPICLPWGEFTIESPRWLDVPASSPLRRPFAPRSIIQFRPWNREMGRGVVQILVARKDLTIRSAVEVLQKVARAVRHVQRGRAAARQVTPERAEEALRAKGGSVSAAAKMLKCSRPTLYRVIKENGIPYHSFKRMDP